MQYELTARAEEDIIEIYVAGARRFGTGQAERYHAELLQCFDTLATHPFIARERQEFRPPVHLHPHQAHLVVYTIADDHILIIRVLHHRQAWEKLL